MLPNKTVDITSEEYRIFTYPDGSTFRVDNPVSFTLIENEHGFTMRVIDAQGLTHRPSKGWNAISWKPKEGQPAFVA